MTSLFFGDRVGRFRDPLGNIWWIQAHVEDVDPEEMARRPHDPAAIEAFAVCRGNTGRSPARGRARSDTLGPDLRPAGFSARLFPTRKSAVISFPESGRAPK